MHKSAHEYLLRCDSCAAIPVNMPVLEEPAGWRPDSDDWLVVIEEMREDGYSAEAIEATIEDLLALWDELEHSREVRSPCVHAYASIGTPDGVFTELSDSVGTDDEFWPVQVR